MTKKTRRGLFYGLIALFLVMGTAVVLYAQGWRLDLQTGRVSKIGAIYVRSYPKEASIAIGGKPVPNKVGFLNPGTLISDLFPKTYTVQLMEAGYDSWRENVTVLPSLVALLKYAVLVPQEAMMAASGTAEHFFAAQGRITKENPAGIISVNGEDAGKGTLMSTTADGRAFIFREANGDYRLYDAGTSTTTNLSAVLRKDGIPTSTIKDVILDPRDHSQILITGRQKIWALDLGQQSLTLIEKTPTMDVLSSSIAVSNALIAWTRFKPASDTSKIVLYERNAGNLRETSTTIPEMTQGTFWIHDGLLGILQSDGSLYLYESGNDVIRKLASDVKDFSASEDGTMVAALEHTSLEVFSPDDPAGYYRFNLPDIAQAQDLIWYKDDNHLFVVYPDHVSFLDLQDAGLTNFTNVTQGTSPTYDMGSNSLYFISPSSQLMRLDFPS